jgi:ankyrin repeat protein
MKLAGKSTEDVFPDSRVVNLVEAVADNDTNRAKALLAEGVDINAAGEAGLTPLIWMIGQHNNKAIHLLLELGADPNKSWQQGENPVYMAASDGNLPLLTMLLDYHGDPNSPAHERSAMMIAMTQLHFDCAQLLVKRGADINFHTGVVSSIIAPLSVGHFDWVVWMLENGYSHDLPQARRGVTNIVATGAQAEWKNKALQIINQRIDAQAKVN